MNYIGSKYSLIDFLEVSIDKTLKLCNETRKPSEMVFADLFAGTGVVSGSFKKQGYSIIANDIQYYSYAITKHMIENNGNHDKKRCEKLIEELNQNDEVNGILLQHPVPAQIDEHKAFNKISPEKDVDGFHVINRGKLAIGEDCFVACTPLGVITMLKHENIEIEGKRTVIVGHSKTKNLKEICAEADILIAAIGKPKFITEDMVKEGAVVVDVGINRIDGKLIGDVDFENVKEKTSYITPVPGGVGPMTMAMLMENVLKSYKAK